MTDKKRIILICLIKLRFTKLKIAEFLEISEKSLYRYLKKYPISEQELNNIQINKNSLLNFIYSNYLPNSQIEDTQNNENKKEIQEEKGNSNKTKPKETMAERAERAYKMLDELKKKRGIY